MKFIDLTGQRFGRLVVTKLHHKDKFYTRHWLCKCGCGKELIVSECHIKSGHTKSCGCLNRERCKTQGDHWKKEEIEFLKINYSIHGPKYCNDKLNKGYYSLCHKATKLNLKFNPKHWTKEEINILKEFYPENGPIWCATKLNRPLRQIKQKIRYLGLHTKNRNGKAPREIIYKIDETTVISCCPSHGICKHYKRRRDNNLTCCSCHSSLQKRRNKTEEGRLKMREVGRKWREKPINRFAANLRKRMWESFNGILKNGCQRARGCFRHLDYTPVELYNYLENIKNLQNNKCPYCCTSYDKCIMSIDHIVPLAIAKTEKEIINLFDLKNLSLLCKDCNSSKNDSDLHKWEDRNNILKNCVLDSGIAIG